MKKFRMLFGLSLLTVTAAALPAMAESGTLLVTVPFSFTAGNATLPAGDYVISEQAGNRLMTIQGKGGSAILFTLPSAPGANVVSNVTFRQTSKGAALMGVQMGGLPAAIVIGK